MTKAAQLAVTLYTQTQELTGFICHYEGRLSDLLNGVSPRRENRGRFVELSYVTIQHVDGRKERLPNAYINKATIQLAATIDGDLAKGIGGKVGAKPYPFVEKLPVPVRVQMPTYILLGNMHCAGRQMVWYSLQEKPMFLPLTSVSICRSDNGHWWKVSFAAVNREQMLSLEELEGNKRLEQPEYHKGELCPYAEKVGRGPVLCQEGFCNRCQIWHDFGRTKETGEAKDEARRVPETE